MKGILLILLIVLPTLSQVCCKYGQYKTTLGACTECPTGCLACAESLSAPALATCTKCAPTHESKEEGSYVTCELKSKLDLIVGIVVGGVALIVLFSIVLWTVKKNNAMAKSQAANKAKMPYQAVP